MAPEQRRAAIVEASLPLVLAYGFDVTTRQLADAAGVAEGTLFRVFPDKEALVWAVVGAALDPEPTLRELRTIDLTMPLRQRLEASVEVSQRRMRHVFNLLDALHVNGPPPDHVKVPGRRTEAEINNDYRALLAELIGPDAATLRVSADQLASIMRPFIFAGTHPRIADGHPLTARQIVSVLLDGLSCHPGAPAWPLPEPPPPSPTED